MKTYIKIITLSLLFALAPAASNAQIDLLIDLLYEINFIFGLEGEPTKDDTDFTSYPYDLYSDGRYRPFQEPGNMMSTKAQMMVTSNDRDVFTGFGQIQFSPVSTVTLDLNYQYYHQDRGLDSDLSTSLSNFTFQYNRLRHERYYFWWDLGLSHFAQGDENSMGFSAGTGFVWFIKKPVSLHVGYRYHDFFEEGFAPVSVFDARLQFHIKRYFISGGYQNLSNKIRANTWTMGTGIYF